MIEHRDGTFWYCDTNGDCKRLPSQSECDERILNRQEDLEKFFFELSEWLGRPRGPVMDSWAHASFSALSDAYDRFVTRVEGRAG